MHVSSTEINEIKNKLTTTYAQSKKLPGLRNKY